MHIIVCLAKLMAQRKTLPTSQVLTRMKLYILILIDNMRNTSFLTTAYLSKNLTKNNSPKEICSHSSLSTPTLPQSIRRMHLRPPQPPSFFSSSESVTPYRSRSFFFYLASLSSLLLLFHFRFINATPCLFIISAAFIPAQPFTHPKHRSSHAHPCSRHGEISAAKNQGG